MKRNILYTLFIISFCLSKQISAQCDLPSGEVVNTGSNMTVMLLPDFISSLPITHFSSYLVAHTPDGLLVGSQVVAGVSQTQIAIWGDDASTVEVDGAGSGEAISFQLVVDDELYDVEMPTPVSYITNSISVQITSATSTLVDCSTDVETILGCTDANACNYNSEATEDDNSCINPVACETCSGETDGTGVVVDNNSDDPCVETSNVATQGSFSEGYTVNFETDGSSVTVTFELLDSDKSGVVAYLWRESPFSETFMSVVSGKKFTTTISNQSPWAKY